MSPPRAVRLAAAVLLGAGAAAALWFRAAPIEPFLDVTATKHVHTPGWDVWGVTVRARGGERIDEVRLEFDSPTLHGMGPLTFSGLNAGWTTGFRVQHDLPDAATQSVRVVQKGRVERTYPVTLEDAK